MTADNINRIHHKMKHDFLPKNAQLDENRQNRASTYDHLKDKLLTYERPIY